MKGVFRLAWAVMSLVVSDVGRKFRSLDTKVDKMADSLTSRVDKFKNRSQAQVVADGEVAEAEHKAKIENQS